MKPDTSIRAAAGTRWYLQPRSEKGRTMFKQTFTCVKFSILAGRAWRCLRSQGYWTSPWQTVWSLEPSPHPPQPPKLQVQLTCLLHILPLSSLCLIVIDKSSKHNFGTSGQHNCSCLLFWHQFVSMPNLGMKLNICLENVCLLLNLGITSVLPHL